MPQVFKPFPDGTQHKRRRVGGVRTSAAGRILRQRKVAAASLALGALTVGLCLLGTSTAHANNLGIWIGSSSPSSITINDGGDSGFTIPTVVAATNEIVLNRTAEQSGFTAYPGIFQAGTYTSGLGTHLDTCSSTLPGQQIIFTEWRDVGSQYTYNCNLYGPVPVIGSCIANLGYLGSGEWDAAAGCPSTPRLLHLFLNWGKGINYVGGELNNGANGEANGSSMVSTYDPASYGYAWVVWNQINRQQPAVPTSVFCGSPAEGWSFPAPTHGQDFTIVHYGGASGGTCG